MIVNSHQPPRWHQVLLWTCFGWSVLSFVSAFYLDRIAADTFLSFAASYYDLGRETAQACGAVGAVLLYPVNMYLGRAGGYIFFATVILSVAVVKTRLSLRAVGNGIRDLSAKVVSNAREYRARSLYVEDLDKSARAKEAPDLKIIDSTVFRNEPPRIEYAIPRPARPRRTGPWNDVPISCAHTRKYAASVEQLKILPTSNWRSLRRRLRPEKTEKSEIPRRGRALPEEGVRVPAHRAAETSSQTARGNRRRLT